MFTPSRLAIARKRRGMTLVELGDRVGVSSQSLSNYERGRQVPSAPTLRSLAGVLDFPLGFFSAPDLDEIDGKSVNFRARSKLAASTREAALAESRLAVELSHWLDGRFKLPSVDLPTPGRKMDPGLAVDYLRSTWRLGEDSSIRNMIHLVEAHGVRVFSLAPEHPEVDAFSFWRDGRPYIFLNTMKSAPRSRFDVAHELGHLIMHADDEAGVRTRAAEKEADEFASNLLMPRRSLAARIPDNPTTDQVIRLKKHWNVSALALTYRLHALGRITDWQYRQSVIELGRLGYRTGEPNGGPHESSMLLQKVFTFLREQEITPRHVAHELNTNLRELNSWVFGLVVTATAGEGQGSHLKRPHLHLVK
ncbi:ImmA/IrrE family metallo-endopeptidase [Streptomyces sp. SID5770]|uniref:helix-turn-helix domain-containing protein n=1 Tax=unclassified Streptomyces TaxID=2593676 RepID=UPI00136A9582|nr:ImmA/IrrE family metallo-endopeptidase [Streptomyces sp. SID5770]MZE56081.1 ImmA/IrrE family metallo-endopeptidase [Streptomyces sp. SID5770]